MPDAGQCVYCHERPVDPHYRPFCSPRCKMADLGRWLRGDYRVPGRAAPEGPEAFAAHGTDGSEGPEETND